MNVLFCHDGPISCDEKNRYHSTGFSDKIMARYESVFGNVSIVTRVERSNATAYKEADKLSVNRYRVVEYPNFLTLKGIFAKKAESKKLLEKEISKCDALIIRLPSFLGNKCVKLARKYNKPYVLEVVGCPWDSLTNHGLFGKVLAPYMYFATRKAVCKATDVLYVTNKFLQRRYPTHGRAIGCSDVELFDNSCDTKKSDERRNINPKPVMLGTLGKIDLKYKGQAIVIKAIAQLKSRGYDVKYQLVGPGKKEKLQNLAEKLGILDSVEFVGAMSHDEVFCWLDTIDIYVHPSLTEGMPRALIEAMSRGCPCIASNAGGMPELLDEKYIFKKGNVKMLSDIIANANENGLFAQGERNREFTKQFAPDYIKEKRTAFYTEFKANAELVYDRR